MSEESSSKDEHPEILKNLGMTCLPVLKIEKLKREDDDEQWISGEELNTDGSSDENGTTTSTKKRRSRVHTKAKITAKDSGPEETNCMSMKESNEVFLNIMEKVNQLQVSFSSNKTKEKIDSPRLIYSNTTAAEIVPNDESMNLFNSSEVLLNAYKQMERLDCLVAKNQEARRAKEVFRTTLSGEEIEPQVFSDLTSNQYKHVSGFEGGDLGQLLSKEQTANGLKDPCNTEYQINDVQFLVNLEKYEIKDPTSNDSNLQDKRQISNKTEDKITSPVHPEKAQDITAKPSRHFIKRNIKLATEGHRMGSLATITDEERVQLDHLLEDLDQHDQSLIHGEEIRDGALGDVGYSLSCNAMGSIQEINSQLKVINEERYSKGDQVYFESVNKPKRCEEAEIDEKRLWKEAHVEMKMKRRLHEINKTLHNINEPSKEVEPIDEARIQQLIDEFCGKALNLDADTNGTDGTACDVHEENNPIDVNGADNVTRRTLDSDGKQEMQLKPVLSSEKVNEIVEMTKSQIPCFKYKHNECNSEK